jgi:transcriptional antiterminator RfaH
VKSWFAVHTQPLAEQKAAGHLERQGFEVYFPRYGKVRRHARRVDKVIRPLFPRYLFVAIDLAAMRWRAIRSTIGVRDLVRAGEAPVPVSDGVVTAIREREDGEGLVRLCQRADLRTGQKLRVLTGALCDQVGLFEDISDDDRVTLLLNLLGRPVRVQLSLDAVGVAS